MVKKLACLFPLWMDIFLVLPTFISSLYITAGFIPKAIFLNQNLSHTGSRRIDCFQLFNLLIMNLLLSDSPCSLLPVQYLPGEVHGFCISVQVSFLYLLGWLSGPVFEVQSPFDSSRQTLLEESWFPKYISLTLVFQGSRLNSVVTRGTPDWV